MVNRALCDVGTHKPSGGFLLLVPGDRAVICSAKPLRSYLLADFIKQYLNNKNNKYLILLHHYNHNIKIVILNYRATQNFPDEYIL